MSKNGSICTTKGLKLDPQSIHICVPYQTHPSPFYTCRRCGLLLGRVGSPPEYFRPFFRNGNFCDSEFSNFDPELLYSQLKAKEDKSPVPSLSQSHQRERSEIIEKCLSLARKCQFSGKTYYLSIAYVDVVLSKFLVKHAHKQLIGMVCVYLAAKVVENKKRILPLENYLHVAECLFNSDQFFTCESFICNILGFKMSLPTAFDFVHFFAGRGFVCEDDLQNFSSDLCLREQTASCAERITLLLLEFCVRWYAFTQFKPSVVAVACMIWARKILSLQPWLPELEALTKLTIESVGPCMDLLRAKFQIDTRATLNRFTDFICYVPPTREEVQESSSSQNSRTDIRFKPQVVALQAIVRRHKIRKTLSKKKLEITFFSAPDLLINVLPDHEAVRLHPPELIHETFELPNETLLD